MRVPTSDSSSGITPASTQALLAECRDIAERAHTHGTIWGAGLAEPLAAHLTHYLGEVQIGPKNKGLARRLGLMADTIVNGTRILSIERSDEIVLLLREAEKFILEGR